MPMKKHNFPAPLALLLLVVCVVRPAVAADTKSQLIQIQTQLQIMQDNMARMQQSFDDRMGSMKDLMTHQADSVNKMGTPLQSLQKVLAPQTTHAASKVDQIHRPGQPWHQSRH